MTSSVLSMRARTDVPGQPLTDLAIALACSSGDPQAVAELFERFQIPVTRYLSRLVPSRDVEDLVQATFLQIARGKARFDGRSSAKTWLFAIATNVMRQHYRSSVRHRRILSALTTVRDEGRGERLTEQLDARRHVQSVCAAFESLPENARLAFVLCELEGLSAKEASQILDSSETAIWKRVSDARKQLIQAVERANS